MREYRLRFHGTWYQHILVSTTVQILRYISLSAATTWAVFALSAVTTTFFVHVFAGRIPVLDDFYYLGFWLDPHWPGLEALWSPLNEHRLPLPKLATWLTARVFGVSLKSMMAVDLAALVGATACLMRAVRRIRGQHLLSDVFFPIVILSVGHAESLLWAVQVNFYLPVVLALVVLAFLTRLGQTPTLKDSLIIGTATVALTLSGVQGVVVALPLAIWQLVPHAGRGRAISATLAVVALTIVVVNVVTYDSPAHHLPLRLNGLEFRYTLRVIGGGWGPASAVAITAEPTMRLSCVGLCTLGLTFATVAALARDSRDAVRRRGSLGLIAFAAGYLALAAGVGTGRAALTVGELANRYMTLMMPLVVWTYVAWVRLGAALPRTAGVIQGFLALLALVTIWPNAVEGLRVARDGAASQTLIERDILLGVPAEFLDAHHSAYLFPPGPGVAGPGLERLRVAGVAPFNRIPPPGTYEVRPADWTPVGVAPAPEAGRATSGTAELIQYTIRFTKPTPWHAIQLGYSLAGVTGHLDSEARWDLSGSGGTCVPRLLRQPLPPGRNVQKLWIGKGVTEVTFTIRGPATLKITSVEGLE